jgi:hypothetical protein
MRGEPIVSSPMNQTTGIFHVDLVKVCAFGIAIALLYGLTPFASMVMYKTDILVHDLYLKYFITCLSIFLLIIYPVRKSISWLITVSEIRMLVLLLVAGVLFVLIQLQLYGDYERAFVVAYTDRTGATLTGILQYVYYPVTLIYVSTLLLYTTYLYSNRKRVNIANSVVILCSLLLLSAMGSRNLLLWSLSGLMCGIVSKTKYRNLILLVILLYLLSVLFAYVRNNGLLLFLLGRIDYLYTDITWQYFDPLAHEFGSAYRTFKEVTIFRDSLVSAPYGIMSSIVYNQLPSFLKPTDFVSFTNYMSYILADPGEGIGSSPMTEAYLSNMQSLPFIAGLAILVYWPAYYMHRWPRLTLISYSLVIAVSFNVWRIGSAEILKMYLSSVLVTMVLAWVCKYNVKHTYLK